MANLTKLTCPDSPSTRMHAHVHTHFAFSPCTVKESLNDQEVSLDFVDQMFSRNVSV